MSINIKNKNQCCGCRACSNICPVQAIDMHIDNECFNYPVVNNSKCTECGLCEKVCPFIHPSLKKHQHVQHVYAAYCKEADLLQKSSSGGLFSVIALFVLQQKGVVYGAAYDETLQLYHMRIDHESGLERLRGSKYIQSDTRDTFSSVKSDLKKGMLVYYVGVPCQIAGLKLFLRKDFDNLITSDLICHGVPSQKIFNRCVAEIENYYHCNLIDYSFRDKNINGWSCTSSSSRYVKEEKVHFLQYDYNMKVYFNAFISGGISRWSCYACPFTTTDRVGDITLADYWGVEKYHSNLRNVNGVSLLIINSVKGEKIFSKIENQIFTVVSKMEYAVRENYNLSRSTICPPSRSQNYDLAFQAYHDFLKQNLPNKRKDFLLHYIRQFLKRHSIVNRIVKTTYKLIKL